MIAESRRSPRWDNTDSVNDRVTKDVSGRELDVHANDRQDKSDWRTRIQDTFNRLKAQGLQLRCPMGMCDLFHFPVVLSSVCLYQRQSS